MYTHVIHLKSPYQWTTIVNALMTQHIYRSCLERLALEEHLLFLRNARDTSSNTLLLHTPIIICHITHFLLIFYLLPVLICRAIQFYFFYYFNLTVHLLLLQSSLKPPTTNTISSISRINNSDCKSKTLSLLDGED